MKKILKNRIVTEVPVPCQESEQSCSCVWGYPFCPFLRFSN